MEFSVDTNNVNLIQENQIESGEFNVTTCQFSFSNEYQGLTKKAVFTGQDGVAYLETIINGECSIPSEVLSTNQVVQIGVYAYEINEEDLVLRYSPVPTNFSVELGSYKVAQNSTPPTPTEIEQLQSQITQNANDIDAVESDVADIKAEQLTQNANIQKNADDISTLQTNYGKYDDDIANLKTDVGNIKVEQTQQNTAIQNLGTTKADKSEIPDVSNFVTKDVDDLTYYSTTNQMNIAINTAVGAETTARQNADNDLQGQIDAITVSSDVIDVLGTYQDLQNYDTTHVKANDIIKVMQDSTHSNAISYYRWVITDHVGAWVYVGSEGPYYTKSETDTLLNEKVDKVSGKGLSTNDFTDAYKNQITANQTAITNIKDGTTIDSFGDVETALSGKEDTSNKVTSLSSSSTDTEYPSAKCVYDLVGDIETILTTLDVGGGVQ